MHLPQPVISAFRMVVSSVSVHRNDGALRGPDVVDACNSPHCGALYRPTGQTRSHIPRADVQEGVDPGGRHVQQGVGEQDWLDHLTGEKITDLMALMRSGGCI